MTRPASRALTLADLKDPREVAFVAALLELGGAGPWQAAEAALRAGYTTSETEAAKVGAILLGSDRIRRALVGEVRARFDTHVPTALRTLVTVCEDPKARASARIAAAKELLDRSSLGPVPSRSVSLHAAASIEDVIAQLDGDDTGTRTVDAKFVEVTPADP